MKRLFFRNACLAALLAVAMVLPSAVQAQQHTVKAGDPVNFTLVARDDGGNIIRDWERNGTPAVLSLVNSTANTDTSTQSWNADPDGYTWARVLHQGTELPIVSPNEWAVAPTLFDNGTVELTLIHSKADTGVFFEITPKKTALNQVSDTYNFIAGEPAHFYVDLTSAVEVDKAVYVQRKYEVIVIPRDRYTNVVEETIDGIFTARWPGEFLSNRPGLAEMYPGKVFITGPTNFFFASTTPHGLLDGQNITVYNPDDAAMTGSTGPYEIRDHAPEAFDLIEPVDHEVVYLINYSNPLLFDWETSTDPYTNIRISAWEPTIVSDVVEYKVVFVDSTSLTNKIVIESDALGMNSQYSENFMGIRNVADQIMGGQNWYQCQMLWLVEATDGLYTTRSTNPVPGRGLPGNYLNVMIPTPGVSPLQEAPVGVTLHQSYPNPVAAGGVTNIRFETQKYGPVKLKVYDMMGGEVSTLADEVLEPGSYNADFRASGLSPGVYHYMLTVEGRTVTKSLIITK